MRAIVAQVLGPPEVLEVMEVPEPEINEDEVLIRVAAAGVNHQDVTERKRSLPPEVKQRLGLECSGTIEKVGKQVKRWKVGQEVCAVLSGGGYAEIVAVQEVLVLPIPKGISLEEAASFPQVACSVWAALFTNKPLNPEYFMPKTKDGSRSRLIAGESILVHGGSGGVGSFAVQLAKALKVNVIVTVSSCNKVEFCKKLGADACITFNYKDKEDSFYERVNEETNNKGVDVVLNSLPVDYVQQHCACVKVGGTIIKLGGCWMLHCDNFAQTPQPKKFNSELVGTWHVGVASFRFRSIQEKTRIVNEVEKNVWPLIERKNVKPVVRHRFPFSRASDAHRLMESGMHLGKILLIPDDRFNND